MSQKAGFMPAGVGDTVAEPGKWANSRENYAASSNDVSLEAEKDTPFEKT
jgi:hypothetical protein